MKLLLPPIVIDHREKKPLPFPEHLTVLDRDHPPTSQRTTVLPLRTLRAELPFGDYCFKDQAHICAIERKANLGELAWNLLTPDRTRSTAAFKRLHDNCAHPWLILETDLIELNSPVRVPHHAKPFDPHAILSALTSYLSTLPRLRVLTLRANTHARRLMVGAAVAHILLSHYPATTDVQEITHDPHEPDSSA